jgi:hypothetical protein
MQKGILSTLLTTILCIGLAATAVSAQDDSDIPNLIAQFRPYWESVTVQTVLYNPEEASDEGTDMQTQLSIKGAVEIPDHNNIIGVTWGEPSVLVLDATGEKLYDSDGMSLFGRFYNSPEMFTPRSEIKSNHLRIPLSVDIPIDPNTLASRVPDSLETLSRLEWSTSLLIADLFTTADVPFEPNETWVELVPGLQIMVETAAIVEEEDTEEKQYAYSIQVIYNPDLVNYGGGTSWRFRRDTTPEPVIFIGLDMLNAEGESVYASSSSISRGSSWTSTGSEDGLVHGTSSSRGSCSNCEEIATIRFLFAHNPYELDVPLALEAIPVPDVDL